MNTYRIMMITIVTLTCISGAVFFAYKKFFLKNSSVIKIGILHSQTGSMATSEQKLIDIELMTIEELNNAGGVCGRRVQAIVADGKSDEFVFAQEAERLITKEGVEILIGCWTSASRKAVKEVVEKYKKLLLYPVHYEGLEESNVIFYLGATPNQHVIPAATWCMQHLGKKFYLIGSDYVFPHVIHKLLRLHIAALGGQVVGETFIKLGTQVPASTIAKIVRSNPDVICNSINGESNFSFFKELAHAGISPEKIPTISFSISEPEIQHLTQSSIVGSYCALTYYQALDNDVNIALTQKFKKMYGQDRPIGEAMQAAYCLLHMWAQAVEVAQSLETSKVIAALKDQIFNGPAGLIYFGGGNVIWQTPLIGKVNYEGKLVPVWHAQKQVCPAVFPPYLSKNEWLEFLNQLYEKWGKRWSIA